jgi:hypothetical protein
MAQTHEISYDGYDYKLVLDRNKNSDRFIRVYVRPSGSGLAYRLLLTINVDSLAINL